MNQVDFSALVCAWDDSSYVETRVSATSMGPNG
jgi:hypothetical protein